MMLGIPVLQVYGLTETTAICTMDDPRIVEPGRVGPAIPGVEMKRRRERRNSGARAEYFSRLLAAARETAKAMEGGWFHTGDQGEADANGNWRITGRMKNLIILNSGHNLRPSRWRKLWRSFCPKRSRWFWSAISAVFLRRW